MSHIPNSQTALRGQQGSHKRWEIQNVQQSPAVYRWSVDLAWKSLINAVLLAQPLGINITKFLAGFVFPLIVIFQVGFCKKKKKNKSVLLLKPKVLHIAPKCISAVFTYAETLIQRCRDFDLVLSESQDQRNNLSEGFSDQVWTGKNTDRKLL